MTAEATEAMRAVRERWPRSFAIRGNPSRVYRDTADPGPRALGKGDTEDEAWIKAAAGLEGRGAG